MVQKTKSITLFYSNDYVCFEASTMNNLLVSRQICYTTFVFTLYTIKKAE